MTEAKGWFEPYKFELGLLGPHDVDMAVKHCGLPYFQRVAAPQGHQEDFEILRYVQELRRLLEVLDRQLAGRPFLVGDEFILADIATYLWAQSYYWAKVSVDGFLNHLQVWFDRVDAPPASQRALQNPSLSDLFGQGGCGRVESSTKRFASDARTSDLGTE